MSKSVRSGIQVMLKSIPVETCKNTGGDGFVNNFASKKSKKADAAIHSCFDQGSFFFIIAKVDIDKNSTLKIEFI